VAVVTPRERDASAPFSVDPGGGSYLSSMTSRQLHRNHGKRPSPPRMNPTLELLIGLVLLAALAVVFYFGLKA